MCINGPTGKWGFNPGKQKGTRIVRETADFYRYLCGWSEVSLTLITDDVALATVSENDEFTEHTRSNVYISAFITCYSRLIEAFRCYGVHTYMWWSSVVLRYRFSHLCF